MNSTSIKQEALPRLVSPTSVTDTFQYKTPPSSPILMSSNDYDREKRPLIREESPHRQGYPTTKRRKIIRRSKSLYNLHDPSSTVQSVRLDHRCSAFGKGIILPLPTRTQHRQQINSVSGDNLAANYPETWALFREATTKAARMNNNIITVADPHPDESLQDVTPI